MNKNEFALTPPMGWNSYDYYNTSTDEACVKANADYMAEHLKDCGWEYIVIDIQWYSKHGRRKNDEYQYIPFEPVEMDEYSRLLPCIERFPSSKGGKGFKPLADYVHSKGLKFGIHIMRGIPRIAAHTHTAIKGTTATANEIADPASTCFWNPDMYGVRPGKEASQAYYDSIMELYAEWGVDYIKCDDICRMDADSAKEEIRMLHEAIMKCGRPIVLSLSPGDAKITEAWWYEKYANMWRITDDFWDQWDLLKKMFYYTELWQNHSKEGCWPDCDMLTLGTMGGYHCGEYQTNFTIDEQKTMLSLWSIFRAPMMLGCEMTMLDSTTLKLITNKDILAMLKLPTRAIQLMRDDNQAIWANVETDAKDSIHKIYAAAFNLSEEEREITVDINEILEGYPCSCNMKKVSGKELWTKEEVDITCKDAELTMTVKVAPHGVAVVRIG